MRKLITVAIAIMVLALAGVASAGEERKTREGWPACLAAGGQQIFMSFMQAIVKQDEFAIQFYMTQKGCGPMLGDMKAEVLERGPALIKVRIHPPAPNEPAVVITVPEAVY
jgi:hypothetical protein